MLAPVALVYTIFVACLATVHHVHSGPVEDKYSCPHGWTRYGTKKCLKYVNELQDYERAQATCRSKNQGTLVTIHSHEEQNFVYSYIHSIAASSTPIWLGAKQIDFESILWLDKTENSYVNWAPSEPSHPDEICIAINPRTGMWHDVMCQEANVPACERAPTTQWPFFVAFCSEGWFQFNDEKCVRIISSQALNFYESQELCRSKYNSKLLSIKSEKEGEFVHNLIKFRDLKLPIWLGAVQNDFSSFNWIDKSDVTFTNWAEGEPNDPDHACISMTASGGKWADNDCKEQKLILCQKVPEDGACETGWLQFRQDQCYRFVHIRLTFDDAETLCNNLYGGHLPSIHSQEEQFMIAQFLASVNVRNGSEIWLGGRQMDFHNFNWGDGSLFNYSYWEHGEPNFPAEKCIEMSWRNGRWNDINCRLKRAVLCERQVTSRHLIGKPNLYSCLSADLTANNCNSSINGIIGSPQSAPPPPGQSQASSQSQSQSVALASSSAGSGNSPGGVLNSNSNSNSNQQQVAPSTTLIIGPVVQSNGTSGDSAMANHPSEPQPMVVASSTTTTRPPPSEGHGNQQQQQRHSSPGEPAGLAAATDIPRRTNASASGEPPAPTQAADDRPIKVISSIMNRDTQQQQQQPSSAPLVVSSILPSGEQLFSLATSSGQQVESAKPPPQPQPGQSDQLLAAGHNVTSSSSSFLSPVGQHKQAASIHYNSAPADEQQLLAAATRPMLDTTNDGASQTTVAPTTPSGGRLASPGSLSDLISKGQLQQQQVDADDAIKPMQRSPLPTTQPEPPTSPTLAAAATTATPELDTKGQHQQQTASAEMAATSTTATSGLVNQQPAASVAESATVAISKGPATSRDDQQGNSSALPEQRPAFVGINRDEHLVVDENSMGREQQQQQQQPQPNGTTSKSDNDNDNNNNNNNGAGANYDGIKRASQGVGNNQVALVGGSV